MSKNSIKIGISEKTYDRLMKRYENMQYGKEFKYCIPKYYDYNLSGFTYFNIRTIKDDYLAFVRFVINHVDIIQDDLEEPVLPNDIFIEKDEREAYFKGIFNAGHVSIMYEIIELCIYFGIGYVYYKINKLDDKIKDYKNMIVDVYKKEYLATSKVKEYVFKEMLQKYNNQEDESLINHTIFCIERFVYNWVEDEIYYLIKEEENDQISAYVNEVFHSLIILGEVFAYNYLNMKMSNEI